MDDEDRGTFLEKLLKVKENNFSLYGYCLMNNHIHLIIKEGEELGRSIKRLTVGYALWHNNKYGRTGHLFQNRFLSEIIDSESYFLTLLRYIHHNPLKAGIVTNIKDYKWSSYNECLASYTYNSKLLDTGIIKFYFINCIDFENYMNEVSNKEYEEKEQKQKVSDTALKYMIAELTDVDKLKKLPDQERNILIKEIYNRTGISVRRLEKLIGISKNKIERAIK
jgi:REP element-mobilizing transposase RayT